MKTTSDLEILTSLETLEKLITGGIKKVEDLLQDVWDKDSFIQIRSELQEIRSELQQSRNTLIENQNSSRQERELLQSVLAEALAQKSLLEQSGTEYKQIYSSVSKQVQQGQACLSSLASSIQNAEQSNARLNTVLQQVEAAQQNIYTVDQKYQAAIELKTQISTIVELMGDYDSFETLLTALKTATAEFQNQQVTAQTQFYTALEPMNRKINRLIMAQRVPWWWPSNWWWKTKVSFTAKHMSPAPNGTKQLPDK